MPMKVYTAMAKKKIAIVAVKKTLPSTQSSLKKAYTI